MVHDSVSIFFIYCPLLCLYKQGKLIKLKCTRFIQSVVAEGQERRSLLILHRRRENKVNRLRLIDETNRAEKERQTDGELDVVLLLVALV